MYICKTIIMILSFTLFFSFLVHTLIVNTTLYQKTTMSFESQCLFYICFHILCLWQPLRFFLSWWSSWVSLSLFGIPLQPFSVSLWSFCVFWSLFKVIIHLFSVYVPIFACLFAYSCCHFVPTVCILHTSVTFMDLGTCAPDMPSQLPDPAFVPIHPVHLSTFPTILQFCMRKKNCMPTHKNKLTLYLNESDEDMLVPEVVQTYCTRDWAAFIYRQAPFQSLKQQSALCFHQMWHAAWQGS